MKQQPTRLTEQERQARRQHQIDLGKATQGYRNLTVLRANGVIPHGPATPDPTVKNVSKRQFDKEIREWRRKLHAFDNVDFNGLKAKVYKHRKHEETDYLNMLLGKEIRDVVHREIMLREQQAAAAKMPDYGMWARSLSGSRDPSVAPSSVSSEGIGSRRPGWSANPEPMKRIMIENDVLRLKIQELTVQNTHLLERLHQQDMLIQRFVEVDMDNDRHRMDYYDRCGPGLGTEESNWFYPPQAV
jgi:hypothetical protein